MAAKGLLEGNIPPEEVIFEKEHGLFATPPLTAQDGVSSRSGSVTKVPPAFIDLARGVACHRDESRWALLYQILWRMVRGGERSLCEISSDPDVSKALYMRKNVSREIHKMHAFVRFNLMATDHPSGRESYAAWFEPEHWIIEAAVPFFRKRFANMDWSIFTPKGCAHWIGEELVFTEGISTNPITTTDAMEEFWKTYYRSIFNPARLKVKMMQTEMPRKYWKNLPEAGLIGQLIQESQSRVRSMHLETPRPAKPAPNNPYLGSLREMSANPTCAGPASDQSLAEIATSAASCQACPLWKRGTGTVFGEGPWNARIMIVGEQPGDQEDIAGRPFVGPAGKLLDKAFLEAGLDRSAMYLTNAVKHFKWTPRDSPRGKIRLHQSPDKGEIDACRPWVLGELSRVAPEVLILLGSIAASSLLGRDVKILSERGLVHSPHLAPTVILTVHPSYLLRLPGESGKAQAFGELINDLRLALG